MLPRRLMVFTAVLVVAAFLYFPVGRAAPPLYWGAALAVAIVLSFISRPASSVELHGGGPFLCDSCRYNYGDVCSRPERPNATRCPDYRPSG